MKYNFCCWNKIKKGYINVDVKDFGQEIITDLNDEWDFIKDNSAEEIIIEDGLEHLDSVINFFIKAEKKLKKGGKIIIQLPHYKSPSAYVLTHKHFFSWRTFDRFPSGYDEQQSFIVISNKLIVEKKIPILNYIANIFPKYFERFFYVSGIRVILEKK